MSKKKKYTIANLVYGQLYPQLWLENHVKSLIDQTNFGAIREEYDIEYALFTDDETLNAISRHPNFMALGQRCEFQLIKINWPADSDKFASRYQVLAQMLGQAINHALESKSDALSVWVADLVFAKGSIPKILGHLSGHDAVFNVPIRCAADSLNQVLAKLPGAPSDLELFEMAYNNLHHLWVASHWDASLFSKFPYSMLWNSGTGLVAHSFGITPIVFKPTEAMREVKAGIDSDLPSFCKNPYWATDWTEAAVAGVEPLSNGHYPPFLQHRANFDYIAKWAKEGTHPLQADYLPHPLYYPSKKTFNAPALEAQALEAVRQIRSALGSVPQRSSAE